MIAHKVQSHPQKSVLTTTTRAGGHAPPHVKQVCPRPHIGQRAIPGVRQRLLGNRCRPRENTPEALHLLHPPTQDVVLAPGLGSCLGLGETATHFYSDHHQACAGASAISGHVASLRLRALVTRPIFGCCFGTTKRIVKGGGPERWRPKLRKIEAPKGGGPKISLFFSHHNFHSSLLS